MRSRRLSPQVWACGLSWLVLAVCAAQAQTPSTTAGAKPSATVAGSARTPTAAVESTPKNRLKNPYTDVDAPIAAAGKDFYFHSGCNGCHGGGGGAASVRRSSMTSGCMAGMTTRFSGS
jgi:mono/diheme cytochrome c family protein